MQTNLKKRGEKKYKGEGITKSFALRNNSIFETWKVL